MYCKWLYTLSSYDNMISPSTFLFYFPIIPIFSHIYYYYTLILGLILQYWLKPFEIKIR